MSIACVRIVLRTDDSLNWTANFLAVQRQIEAVFCIYVRPRAQVDALRVEALRRSGLSWSQVCRTLEGAKGPRGDIGHTTRGFTGLAKGPTVRRRIAYDAGLKGTSSSR